MLGREICEITIQCTRSGGQPALAVAMKKGVRFPPGAGVPVEVRAEDEFGDPLMIGGVPVTFTQVCPALTDAASTSTPPCEPDTLFPPPVGQTWVEYESNSVSIGDGSYQFGIVVTWGQGSCSVMGGELGGSWFSNNGDELYGDTVADLFGEDYFAGPAIPTLSPLLLAALAALLTAFGAMVVTRGGRIG